MKKVFGDGLAQALNDMSEETREKVLGCIQGVLGLLILIPLAYFIFGLTQDPDSYRYLTP